MNAQAKHDEPCIACGAPLDALGRGHDDGCTAAAPFVEIRSTFQNKPAAGLGPNGRSRPHAYHVG